MLKKFLTVACLAVFVASFAACGGNKGDGIRAGVKKEGAKPLSETYEETTEAQMF